MLLLRGEADPFYPCCKWFPDEDRELRDEQGGTTDYQPLAEQLVACSASSRAKVRVTIAVHDPTTLVVAIASEVG
jgi:hypothetical protein